MNPGAILYKIDICSPALSDVFATERPEIVDHHAARTSVNQSLSDPLGDAHVNIMGSLNVLQCCVEFGVRQIIYASTGGALYGEPKYLPCDEDHPINPLSPYGASKHAVEHYLTLYRANWGLDYAILRYPNVYGPRQDSQGEAGVVAIFSDRMQGSSEITIYGSGQQERDFLHVSDVVKANLAVMDRKGQLVYNIGSGGSVSINELFQTMKSLSRYARKPVYGPARSGEVFKIYLDAKRIKADLGWAPSVGLTEGLAATLDHYRTIHGKGPA
jgi:UDP-glucose 4-epimerase